MKKVKILTMLLLLLLTSCVSQHTVNRHAYRPDFVQLRLSMDDYEYLGEVTVETEYKIYLGIFRKMLTVNGEPYDPRTYTSTYLSLYPHRHTSHRIDRAMYKVLDIYPDADYIIPGAYKKSVDHMMIGGRIVREQQTVKVYKLKSTVKAEAAPAE